MIIINFPSGNLVESSPHMQNTFDLIGKYSRFNLIPFWWDHWNFLNNFSWPNLHNYNLKDCFFHGKFLARIFQCSNWNQVDFKFCQTVRRNNPKTKFDYPLSVSHMILNLLTLGQFVTRFLLFGINRNSRYCPEIS